MYMYVLVFIQVDIKLYTHDNKLLQFQGQNIPPAADGQQQKPAAEQDTTTQGNTQPQIQKQPQTAAQQTGSATVTPDNKLPPQRYIIHLL